MEIGKKRKGKGHNKKYMEFMGKKKELKNKETLMKFGLGFVKISALC